MNQRAIVGLERQSEIELECSVGGRGHPVGAAENDSAQALAFEGTTRNRKDRESAVRCRPDLLGCSGRQTQPYQWTGVHGVLTFGNPLRAVREWCRSDPHCGGR